MSHTNTISSSSSSSDASSSPSSSSIQLTPNASILLNQRAGTHALSSTNGEIIQSLTVQIIQIYRFLIEPENYILSTGITSYKAQDDAIRLHCTDGVSGYDLVFHDGIHMRKVLIHPSLNSAIETGQFHVGDIITINEWSIRYEDRRIGEVGHIVVKQVNLVKSSISLPPNLYNQLTWPTFSHPREASLTPLTGNRIYYLSLYNDDTLIFADTETSSQPHTIIPPAAISSSSTAANQTNDAKIDDPDVLTQEFQSPSDHPPNAHPLNTTTTSINDSHISIHNNLLSSTAKLRREDVVSLYSIINEYTPELLNKPIVARIISLSKIIWYGKNQSSSSSHTYHRDRSTHSNPYFFELLISDGTTFNNEAVKCSVWNSLAREYYDVDVGVGQMNGHHFLNTSVYQPNNNKLKVGQLVVIRGYKRKTNGNVLEISVNPYNPAGTIDIIKNEQHDIDTSLLHTLPPDIQSLTVPIQHMMRCPDNWYFDLCGLVIYVSPRLRELTEGKNAWVEYRWLLVVDDSVVNVAAGANADAEQPPIHPHRHAVAIKVYTNSQSRALYNIRAGQLVFLQNLHIFTHNAITHSTVNVDDRSFHLLSNQYTRVYRADYDTLDAIPSKSPRINELLNWYNTQLMDTDVTDLYRTSRSLYKWQLTLDQYMNAFGDKLTPLKDVVLLKQYISVYQSIAVLLQATIVDITFTEHAAVPPSKEEAQSTTPPLSQPASATATDATEEPIRRSKRQRKIPPTPAPTEKAQAASERRRSLFDMALSGLRNVAQYIGLSQSSTEEGATSSTATEASALSEEGEDEMIPTVEPNELEAHTVIASFTLLSRNQDTTITMDIHYNPVPYATTEMNTDITNNPKIPPLLIAMYRVLPDTITSSNEFQLIVQNALQPPPPAAPLTTTQSQADSSSKTGGRRGRKRQQTTTAVEQQPSTPPLTSKQQIEQQLISLLNNRGIVVAGNVYRQSGDNVHVYATSVLQIQ